MRNLTAYLLALLALVSLCATACSQGEKSKELAALDKAYRSGVLTLGEYQTKKAAIEARETKLAAIEKAHADGVLNNDEYVEKKSTLLATTDPLPATPAAQPAVTASAKPASADSHSYRMKMVKVMDAQGFASPIVSATLLVPVEWQSQGATTWNLKDKCNTIQTSVRATGPDGRAFEVFPAFHWSWADDPSFLRQTAAQQARLGAHACDVMPPMGAADYLKKNLGRIRPNATLAAIEPAPKLMQILQDRARQSEQAAAQYRLQKRIRPDVIRALLKYTLNGQSVEEWIIVATIIDGTAGLKGGYSYNCLATLVAERAPQGQLDASEKLFDLINSTYRVDQAWQGRVTQNALAVQKIRAKGVQDRANIVSKNAEDIRNIQREGYENQQKGQDQSAAGFSQYLRGTETYQNPATGEKVDLDSKYGNAWVNSQGEYLLSDQVGFDPNTVLQGSWTPMQHVKP